MSAERAEILAAMFAGLEPGGPALLTTLPDGLGLKVVSRGDRRMVCAWADRRLSARALEEIGEDAGLFDPRARPWTCAESQRAHLIVDVYSGGLCEHEFSHFHADGRGQYWNYYTCTRCGLRAISTHSRRGQRVHWAYDTWELRHHIWQAWMRRGPVPGAMQPQAHHK